VLTRHRAAVVAAAVAASCALAISALAPAVAAPPRVAAVPASPERPALPGTAGALGFGRPAGTQLVRDLRAAWQISKGDGATVAVIAGGVDGSAPGLSGKVTAGPSFGNSARYPKVVGTVLASAVAASGPSTGNPLGTVGLAPAARILSLRVPWYAPEGVWQEDVARAIRYAVRHGAKVIFVGAYGPTGDIALDGAVQYAVSKGAVMICDELITRRSSRNAPMFPNSLPGVLGVASVVVPGLTQPPPRRYATPANDSILVSAPGNVLTVSGPLGLGYTVFNALAASAWLIATVAIIKSVYPKLPSALVARALALSARGHPKGGYNTKIGFGMINPIGALREVGRLRALHTVAAAGPGVAAPSARLAAGPAPGPINAVRHATVKLAAYGGGMAAGLVLLLLAALVRRRRPRAARRRPRAASGSQGLPY
jgi:subtilase family protein